ncbi:MAG: MFS transporter [bacterium]|nr:MFS transporter [bacterium]
MQIRNLYLLYIIKISKWFMLYMPISYLFYLENGFKEFEYLTLHAVYSGVIAFCEVPSGYIADVWGRKKALVSGTFFGALGFGVYSLTGGLYYFLAAEILLGIGSSLLSGADSAMLYDTLLEKKKVKYYIKYEGYITALGNFSEVLAALFVSVFIFTSYRQYFQLQMIIALAGFLAAIFLMEPKIHEKKMTGSIKDIFSIVSFTFKENRKLRNIVIFSSVIGFASLSMAWLAQPLLRKIGIEESTFGYSWALLNLLVTIGSFMSMYIYRRLNYMATLLFIAIPLSLGYFFIGFNITYWSLIPLVIFFFVRGAAHPILKKHINDLVSSEKRATVLSLRSLIIRILFLIMGPVIGVVTERINLELGIILCGITVLIPSVIFVSFLTRDS